jgi:hypothetical protein
VSRESLRNGLVACGIIAAVMIGMLIYWQLRSDGMRDSFVQALQSGTATETCLELRDKTWSDDELAAADVVLVPESAGREQAILRTLHSRGRIVLAPRQFQYQGTIRDASTGRIHVFGFPRREPRKWRWTGLHPDSLAEHIQQRAEQLERLQDRQPD